MEIFLMRHATTAQLYVVEGFAKARAFCPILARSLSIAQRIKCTRKIGLRQISDVANSARRGDVDSHSKESKKQSSSY
jgi:hypothetical protein